MWWVVVITAVTNNVVTIIIKSLAAMLLGHIDFINVIYGTRFMVQARKALPFLPHELLSLAQWSAIEISGLDPNSPHPKCAPKDPSTNSPCRLHPVPHFQFSWVSPRLPLLRHLENSVHTFTYRSRVSCVCFHLLSCEELVLEPSVPAA